LVLILTVMALSMVLAVRILVKTAISLLIRLNMFARLAALVTRALVLTLSSEALTRAVEQRLLKVRRRRV
jgi:hypothetical protein